MTFMKTIKGKGAFFKEKTKFLKNIILNFLKNNFEVKSSKRSKTTGIVILAITLLWVVLSVNTYISQEFAGKWWLLSFALFCPFILGLTAAFTVVIKNDLFNKIWHLAGLLLMPFATITMTECLNNVFIYNMTYLAFWGIIW